MKIGAIVIAAGYGSFRRVGDSTPYPKILEDLGGKPVIGRVLETLRGIGINPIVVVNPLFESQIQDALLASGFRDVNFIIQPDRFGTADAVERALPILEKEGVTDFLAMYADMPLWKRETLGALIDDHLRTRPVLSMVSVPLKEAFPIEVERYGRIVRNREGEIVRIFEVGDTCSDEPLWGRVNPSLWIWNTDWVSAHISLVPPCARPDGGQSERQLPLLVGIASRESASIAEMPLRDPAEALGLNNLEELALVRSIFAERLGKKA